MNAFDMFKTNPELEKSGVAIPYGEFNIIIARAGGKNRMYANLLTETFKPHQRQINNETIDPDLMNELMIKVYAKTVVKGWDGIKDSEGKDLEFSAANCIKLFKELPDLFEDVRAQSTRIGNFRDQVLEDDAKK